MKIVFLDAKTVGSASLAKFEEIGEFEVYETTAPDDTARCIADAQVAITNKVFIGKKELDACKNLKLICVAATGTNNIDLEACKNAGVAVCNVAGYSTASVVQVAFASILAFETKTNYFDSYVKNGEYANSDIFVCMDEEFSELAGKSFCIVGLGAIGKSVYKAAQALGYNCSYYSTSGANEAEGFVRASFEELLTADIVSIHCGLNEQTKGLFDEVAISKMKKTAILANFGRGGIVVESAVAKAVDEDRLGGYVTDVFEQEPIRVDSPLMTIKNRNKVLFTPHIAWASKEARARLMHECLENIKVFMDGKSRNRVV
jgi:lactate dehydrogenase-like 2-hydroxyacid dehydrogenase